MIFSAFSLKRVSLIVLLSMLTACQTFSNGSNAIHIENPKSHALKFLMDKKDVPGKWSWSLISTDQPNQAEWNNQENLMDSASSYLAGDYWFAGKQYHISIFHNVAQYAGSTPERELSTLDSIFDNSEEIKPDDLQSFGDNMIARCFNAKSDLECSVVVSYPSIESSITIIAPKELGMQELENLLNSILKANDDKVISIVQH